MSAPVTPVYLRAKQICKSIGISRNTWLNWVDEGRAPAGIVLGKRVTVWLKSEVDDFIKNAARREGVSK